MPRDADGTLTRTAPQERVRSTYDRTAGVYAHTVARLEAPSQRRALDRLDLSGRTVLDIGCGPGVTLATLAHRVGPGGHAVGVDAAPGMLQTARRRVGERENVSLALGDARRLPVAAGRVDVVCAMDVLDLFCLGDLSAVLRECRRVLVPDGRLCVVTMDRTAVPNSTFLRAYEWAYERVPGFDRVGCRPIPVGERLRAAGFAVHSSVEFRRAGVWPVTALVAAPSEPGA